MASPAPIRLREARDGDSPGIIALIEKVYAEYPGNVLDVEREEPGLKTPASSYERFWVLEQAGRIAGCGACVRGTTASGAPCLELKKLYLDPGVRGRGWSRKLVELVEEHARRLGWSAVELWTDTRFVTAHRVYEHLGYARSGRVRELHDRSRSVEYHYRKTLGES